MKQTIIQVFISCVKKCYCFFFEFAIKIVVSGVRFSFLTFFICILVCKPIHLVNFFSIRILCVLYIFLIFVIEILFFLTLFMFLSKQFKFEYRNRKSILLIGFLKKSVIVLGALSSGSKTFLNGIQSFKVFQPRALMAAILFLSVTKEFGD